MAAAAGAGEPVPELVLAAAGGGDGGPDDGGDGVAGRARLVAGRVLVLVQEWLGLDVLVGARLVTLPRWIHYGNLSE